MHACVYLSVSQCVSIVGRWGAWDTKTTSADAIVRGRRIILAGGQNVLVSRKDVSMQYLSQFILFDSRILLLHGNERLWGKNHCVC